MKNYLYTVARFVAVFSVLVFFAIMFGVNQGMQEDFSKNICYWGVMLFMCAFFSAFLLIGNEE